jgi:hypothetical protein
MSSGVLLFSKYAYPPNALGYCGPDHAHQLLEQASCGAGDGELRVLARGFDGAWPYLELIAATAGIQDPLDERVVEAYWVGNSLLDRVGPALMGASMQHRFKARAGRSWEQLADAIPAGAVPHHSFHVLGVYPWLGLLREGRFDEPMRVLQGCRIRWGRIEALDGETAIVRSEPLQWDGRELSLGTPTLETVRVFSGGLGLAGDLAVGNWCSLHWDWVCERLSPRRLASLKHYTMRQVSMINALPVPAPAAVLS